MIESLFFENLFQTCPRVDFGCTVQFTLSFISRIEVAETILHFVLGSPDWTLHGDHNLHFKCDFQEVFLVWDRYFWNNISTSCQGTEKCCLWCLQKEKAVWFVLFKNSYRPMSSQSLFLWAKSMNMLFSCCFCRIWCFIFRVFASSCVCLCVWAFVFACTCPSASGAPCLCNGVLGLEGGRKDRERESAA